jgi:hypothetical protein
VEHATAGGASAEASLPASLAVDVSGGAASLTTTGASLPPSGSVMGKGLPDDELQPSGAASDNAARDATVKCKQQRKDRDKESRAFM